MTDAELIKAIQDKSLFAFKELVERYEGRIAATVYGMLGNTPEADDIGQEVFIRFYKNIDNFRNESSLITYLTRIAINLSINEIRRKKRRSLLFFNPTDTESLNELPDTSVDYNRNELIEIVNKALKKLDAKHRSVVVLRAIDGYSNEETAKILEIPMGTVLSRFTRGQKKLESILKYYLEESA